MQTSTFMRASVTALALHLLAPASATADAFLPKLVYRPKAGSQLIPCGRASEHLIITHSAHLDPACTYTGGVEIVRSDIVFDCRGALIDDPERDDSGGIVVHGPATAKIANVSVRNCRIRGFLNNFRVTRDGFRALQPGSEYDAGFGRIELRNSRVLESRGSGVFIDAYVSGVRLRDLEVGHSDGVGIYLEAGSRDTRILRSYIHDNGYGDVDPVNGAPLEFGGMEFRYLSTGREGLAIDGSRENYVARNVFERNSNGAIFLYKNCGEYSTERPQQWWPRRYGADRNRIRRNTIIDEPNGIWVGSRMSENQAFLDCSDDFYFANSLQTVHEDFAKHNLIQSNTFRNVAFAIRIEDDHTRVERNSIHSANRDHLALLVGTGYRASILGRPVTGSVIQGNYADVPGNIAPFVWIHSLGDTVFRRNRAGLRSALFPPIVPPATNFHLFMKQLWLAP